MYPPVTLNIKFLFTSLYSPCQGHASFSYSPVSHSFYDLAQVSSVTEPQVVSPVSYHIVLHVFLYGPGPCSALGNPGHVAAQWLTQEGDYLFSIYWMEQNFLLHCFSGTQRFSYCIILFPALCGGFPFLGNWVEAETLIYCCVS